MRWGALFGDMEAQLAEAARLEWEAQAAELTRAERSGARMVDRLRSSLGRTLEVTLESGLTPTGTLRHAGNEWLVLESGPQDWLIPTVGIVTLRGVAREAAPEAGTMWQRAGLAGAFRVIAQDRALVRVFLSRGGPGLHEISGVISAVGQDHLDLLLQDLAGERRGSSEALAIPFRAIIALRGEEGAGAFGRL